MGKHSTSGLINHLKNRQKEEYQKIQQYISTDQSVVDDVVPCSSKFTKQLTNPL